MRTVAIVCCIALAILGVATFQARQRVGPDPNVAGRTVQADASMTQGTGLLATFHARPVDVSLSPDGRWCALKDNQGVRLFQASDLKEISSWKSPDGTSAIGLRFSATGQIWVTTGSRFLIGLTVADDGTLTQSGKIDLGSSYPCGISITKDNHAFVALSTKNQIADIDLNAGKVIRTLDVGVAPFDVQVDETSQRAFVSEQGGAKPAIGAFTAKSAGSDVEVEDNGIAKAGALACIDLANWKLIDQVPTAQLPASVAYSSTTGFAFVACSNSDEILAYNPTSKKVVVTRLPASKKLATMPCGMALVGDRLEVTLAGGNRIDRFQVQSNGSLRLIDSANSDWFPVAIASNDDASYVVSTKGLGSRTTGRAPNQGFNSYDFTGSIRKLQKVDFAALPPEEKTRQTFPTLPPIKHVVYVIKENRTYDQVFGDIKEADGDPDLCVFGNDITPNQHALSRAWVTLDNYYCSGVLSADGHSWATEGNSTPYLERSFGGFNRSYTFGDDPLTYSSTGFIWDAFIKAKLSFRNYGEFDYASSATGLSSKDLYAQSLSGKLMQLKHSIGVDRVKRYSYEPFPGWNLGISDQYRIDRFNDDFQDLVKQNKFPNLAVVYLPQDHTGGPVSPKAHVADNDLAVGRLIQTLSHGPFWKDTVVFVTEDDPQAGYDHVDGHRSTCLIIGPYVKRGVVSSSFHTQSSVLHTICDLFRLPQLNQKTAIAPGFNEIWTQKPDLTPFDSISAKVALTQAPPSSAIYKKLVASLDLRKHEVQTPRDMDSLNRAVWFSIMGSKPYPAALTGAHGKGLAKKGLAKVVEDSDGDGD